MRLILPFLFVLALVSPSQQSVSIDLYASKETNASLRKYTDNDWFVSRYANFPKDDTLRGYVWQWDAFPNNACLYIPPLPASVKVNSSKWFALVEDFLDCPDAMIENVRNAEFDLVIAYTNSSSIQGIPKSLKRKQFPIVVISRSYAGTLWDEAATNALSDAVLAKVAVYNEDVIAMGLITGFSCIVLFSLSCFVCVCCLKYCNRRGQYTINNPPFHERYRQARMARQELIESILRQLQELQGEQRQHVPLGEAKTKALPLKSFFQARRESSGKETCAICVEDFQENDMTRILPCNHFFHPDCIDPWLISHSSMCPLCKRSVSNEPRASGARTHPHLEATTEDEESISIESFGTPVLALTDVTDSPSPVPVPPMQSTANRNVNSDDLSVSSDTPLLGTGSPANYTST